MSVKRFLLFAIGMMFSVAAMAQVSATNPEEADYYIKGYLSVERTSSGGVTYKLTDVSRKGITFSTYTMHGTEDGESVYFTMKEAGTDPEYPGGFEAGLQFWRFDDDIEGTQAEKWQTDSEFRPSALGFEQTKTMALVMLIDCSNSLGNDFSKVKNSALNFINRLYKASAGRGNINLGIIGFSSIGETKFFEIRPLTENTYNDIEYFIKYTLSQTHDGTALFFSMDKAVDMIEEYYEGLDDKKAFAKAEMFIFTDGLDQTSNNRAKNIITTDEYLEYVKGLKGKMIGNVRLCSHLRGVRGVDIKTEGQLLKFERLGREIVDDFKLLANVSALDAEFEDYAKDLINQWQNLYCYAPNSYKGRVAWTFRNTEKPKPLIIEKHEEPKQKGKLFCGINAGIGISYYSYYYSYTSIAFSGGLDIAFQVKEHSGFGFYGSVGFENAGESVFVNGGLLGLVGFNNGGALYLGGGYTYAFRHDGGADFRVGYKFKNGLYLFSEGCAFFGGGTLSMLHVGYFL